MHQMTAIIWQSVSPLCRGVRQSSGKTGKSTNTAYTGNVISNKFDMLPGSSNAPDEAIIHGHTITGINEAAATMPNHNGTIGL